MDTPEVPRDLKAEGLLAGDGRGGVLLEDGLGKVGVLMG